MDHDDRSQMSPMTTTSGSDGSQAQREAQLSSCAMRVKDIVERNTQPFSALTELHQAGVVSPISIDYHAVGSGQWSASMVTTVSSPNKSVGASGVGQSKSQARSTAAVDLLSQIAQLLDVDAQLGATLSTAESSQAATSAPRASVVSGRQIAEMAVDNLHLLQVMKMAGYKGRTDRSAICISIDIEMWELNDNILLEVGLTFWSMSNGLTDSATKSYHLVVKEYVDTRNGKWCVDNKDNFLSKFGESEILPIMDIVERTRTLIETACSSADKVFVVGHTLNNDLKWLRRLPGDFGITSMEQCDIARAFRALRYPTEYVDLVGMASMMHDLGIDDEGLHNGGNDAAYNIMVLDRLMSLCTNRLEEKLSVTI